MATAESERQSRLQSLKDRKQNLLAAYDDILDARERITGRKLKHIDISPYTRESERLTQQITEELGKVERDIHLETRKAENQ